jgi:hypothetical protein
MNERIKELAEQAGSTHKQSLGVYQFYGDELGKFAELIVKECIDCAVSVGHSSHRAIEPIYTIHEVKRKIKQHFGVES